MKTVIMISCLCAAAFSGLFALGFILGHKIGFRDGYEECDDHWHSRLFNAKNNRRRIGL